MITGDNINTATAIAKECGIVSRNWFPEEFSFTVMEA
jgi:magnesium-transporting ATPase (P-type)